GACSNFVPAIGMPINSRTVPESLRRRLAPLMAVCVARADELFCRAVVGAEAERGNMVDIYFVRKQLCEIDILARVRAFAIEGIARVEFFPQAHLEKIARIVRKAEFGELLPARIVLLLITLLLAFDLGLLLRRMLERACEFDRNFGWRTVAPDQFVHDPTQLSQSDVHGRVGKAAISLLVWIARVGRADDRVGQPFALLAD